MSDEIVFDYNHRPLVSEHGIISDYISALVEAVKKRAGAMGLSYLTTFKFVMSPGLWEDVSAFYACQTDADEPLPDEAVRERWEKIKKRQTIVVGKSEYPVEFDLNSQDSMLFTVEPRAGIEETQDPPKGGIIKMQSRCDSEQDDG